MSAEYDTEPPKAFLDLGSAAYWWGTFVGILVGYLIRVITSRFHPAN